MANCLQLAAAQGSARPAAAWLSRSSWSDLRRYNILNSISCFNTRARSCFPSAQLCRSAALAGLACRAVDNSSSSSPRTLEAGRALDAFIGPGLQLHEQAYNVQGRVLRLISPLDVDAVLDLYIAQGLDRDPYWCRAWPSAICLAQQLLQRPELVAGKVVADFGSGLGVAGLAAALAGAREVVLLDREPMALYCGLMSAAATGIQGVTGAEQLLQLVAEETSGVQQMPTLTQQLMKQLLQQQQQQQPELVAESGSQQQSRQHLQTTDTPQQQQHPAITQCTYRALPFDWSSSKVTERYDVILACDVLYEAEAVDLVASVIPKLLKPGNTSTLLLADPPNRTVANRQRFLDLIAAAQPTRLLLQESGLEQCDVQQLDPEMLGGVTSESVAVQFMVFQSAVGNDTIGLKAV